MGRLSCEVVESQSREQADDPIRDSLADLCERSVFAYLGTARDVQPARRVLQNPIGYVEAKLGA